MGKKYYLSDAELHSVDDDFFRHQDVTDSIEKILVNNEPPYNIAIIGKWGLGKSSLINLVTDKLGRDQANYTIVPINAWKYEKEALAKVFLRQVLQKLDGVVETRPEKAKKTIEDIFKAISLKSIAIKWQTIVAFVKENIGLLVGYPLVMFFIYAIYTFVYYCCKGDAPTSILLFFGNAFIGFCKNVAVVLFAPLLLLLSSEALAEIRKKEKISFGIPDNNLEDYEILLARSIKKNPKIKENHKIVIILDDLDRLSSKKMVEALDAIKLFINYDKCIFLVPFDDSILKNAITNERSKGSNNSELLFESELLLDKLFQYKVYLAPLLQHDIKQYAVDLCIKNMTDFTKEYCNEKLLESILYHILIHGEVETPRQVKKLVNVFATNYMIACEREKAGSVEKNFATSDNGAKMIAKLSVLQADFNEFYDLLFVCPDAMQLVPEANRDAEKLQELPVELKRYFSIREGDQTFSKKYMPLISFLTRTAKYNVPTIESYLYIAMDEISVKTGSKKQQDFIHAATSANVTGAKQLLGDDQSLWEAGKNFILQEDEIEDIKNVAFCLIYSMDLYSLEVQRGIVDAIAERADEMSEVWSMEDEDNLHFENLVRGYKVCTNKTEYQKMLQACIGSSYDKRVDEKLSAFMKNTRILDEKTIRVLQEHIIWLLKGDHITPDKFRMIKADYKGPSEEWLQEYYNYLIRHLEKAKDYSHQVVSEVQNTFTKLMVTKDGNKLFSQLKPLFGIAELLELFCELVLEIGTEKLDADLGNELVNEQIALENVKSDKLNSLLEKVHYELEAEEVPAFDKYFATQVGTLDFEKLLETYALNNDMDLLTECFVEWKTWVVDDPDNEKVQSYQQILPLLSDDQREKMITQFETMVTYSTSKQYVEIAELLRIHMEYKESEVKPVFDKMFRYVNSQTTNEHYIDFTSDCIQLCAKYLEEEKLDTYIEDISKKLKQGYFADACIHALWKLKEYISKEDFLNVVPELEEYLTAQNCIYIFEIMEKNEKYITKDAGNLNAYVKICYEAIKNSHLGNRGIDALGRKFIYLGDLAEFVEIVLTTEDLDMEKVSSIFNKFVDKKPVEFFAKDLVAILEKYPDEKLVKNAVEASATNNVAGIGSYIVANKTEFSVKDVLNYMKFVISCNQQSHKELLADLAITAADISETEKDYKEITTILVSIPAKYMNGVRKKYIAPISNLMNHTTSDDLTAQLYEMAKKVRIISEVKNQLVEPVYKKVEKYR